MKKIILIILFCCLYSVTVKANDFTGKWAGTISVIGQEINMIVNITQSGDSLIGTIDIPIQGAMGLKLDNVKYIKPNVKFDLLMVKASFSGELKEIDGKKKIEGEFLQSGVKGKFNLNYSGEVETKNEKPDIKDYIEEEVVIKNKDITLAGTFSKPKTGLKYPAVILITGSGPQNRDEEIFGFKIFRLINDNFVSKGIAVLRLDDRGIGGSTDKKGGSSTTLDFVTDISSAVDFLKGRSDVESNKIGLFGHSEGGLISYILASQSKDIAFIISMAGPSLRGDSLLIHQIEKISRTSGASEDEIKESLKWQNKSYDALRSDKGWDEINDYLMMQGIKQRSLLSEELIKSITDSIIQIRVNLQLSQLKSPWMRMFLDLDPADYIPKIKCPALMLFGEKDVQVPAEENKTALERMIKMNNLMNFTIKVIPQANHLFQKIDKGTIQEYAILDKKFTPEFLETIDAWLKANVLK